MSDLSSHAGNRGTVVTLKVPDPFHTSRTYVELALEGDDNERYERIRAAKDAKVRALWYANPETPFHKHNLLTRGEVDAALAGEPPAGLTAKKRCGLCGRTKTRGEFSRDCYTSDGLRTHCRDCDIKKDRARVERARTALAEGDFRG